MGGDVDQRRADALAPKFGLDKKSVQLRLLLANEEDRHAGDFAIMLGNHDLVPLDHRDG